MFFGFCALANFCTIMFVSVNHPKSTWHNERINNLFRKFVSTFRERRMVAGWRLWSCCCCCPLCGGSPLSDSRAARAVAFQITQNMAEKTEKMGQKKCAYRMAYVNCMENVAGQFVSGVNGFGNMSRPSRLAATENDAFNSIPARKKDVLSFGVRVQALSLATWDRGLASSFVSDGLVSRRRVLRSHANRIKIYQRGYRRCEK